MHIHIYTHPRPHQNQCSYGKKGCPLDHRVFTHSDCVAVCVAMCVAVFAAVRVAVHVAVYVAVRNVCTNSECVANPTL